MFGQDVMFFPPFPSLSSSHTYTPSLVFRYLGRDKGISGFWEAEALDQRGSGLIGNSNGKAVLGGMS